MEYIPASVVVLERCRRATEPLKTSPKFCCVCGWNVSQKINPTMTHDQCFIFNRFILHPSCSQKLTPTLQQSKWICTICQTSLEQVEFVNGEIVKMEKVLKQLVELLRLKMAQYSLVESQSVADVDFNGLEDDVVGVGKEYQGRPFFVDEDELKEEVDKYTDILIAIEDDIKPIAIVDNIDLSPDDNCNDSDGSLNLARLEKLATPPQPLNCMENDQEEPATVTSEVPASPLVRSTRQSKLRANEVIRSLINRDENGDVEDIVSSATGGDEDYVPPEDSSKEPNDSRSYVDSELESNNAKTEIKPTIRIRKIKKTVQSGDFPSFICEVCKKEFTTQPGLVYHKFRFHNIPHPLACGICKDEFPTRKARRIHQEKIHAPTEDDDGPPFVCKVCKSVFNTRLGLDVHKRSHNIRAPRPFLCDLCEKSYTSNRCLTVHKNVIHGNVHQYPCKQCDYKSWRRDLLSNHIASHHGSCPPPPKKLATKGTTNRSNRHYCLICKISYSFKKSLLAHNKRVHDTDKTFKCGRPNCKRTFYTQSKLDEHLKHFHPERGDVDKTLCEICQEKFPHIRAKIDHIKRAHRENEKFACTLCKGLEFPLRSTLTNHMKQVHHGEKPFLCCHCGRRFSQVTAYNLHLEIVCNPDEEEKERNRKRRTELQIKYRERARKKSLRCKFCKTLFLGQRRLECHIARYHGDNQDDDED